ncbi:MAG: hypothetical protein ACLQLC_21580 [Candidatus Sulfotelmatobacter sp.]
MKIGLPSGWFARILLGGWALFFVGTLLFFLIAFFAPGRLAGHLITPLLTLSILVMLGTFLYITAYAVRRLFNYLGRAWRKNDSQAPLLLRPVERILVAGWLLFVAAALASLLLSHERWVLAYAPEVLLSFFCVVVLSSTMYGSYLLIREVARRVTRR